MNTHQVAKALAQIAAAMRALPNMELELFLSNIATKSATSPTPVDDPNTPVTVGILTSLSRYDKSDWRQLIEKWKLPIHVPRKDSSRNVMDSVMRYLETHPEEIRRIQNGNSKESRASPALLKALSILLAPDTSEEPQSRD